MDMSIVKTYALAILGLLFLAGCQEQQIGATSNASEEATETTIAASSEPRNGVAKWPPLSQDDQTVVAHDDPFAKNVMLVIDTSGSMDGAKIKQAREAAAAFVDLVPADAAIGLVEFGGDAQEVVPLAFNNHQNVKAAIADLRSGGGTPMATGIFLGYKQLEAAGRAQFGYGEYFMAVLGDGAPNNASTTTSNLDWMVHNSPINVHTIGFQADLSILARPGIVYHEANDQSSLQKAFAAVLAEAKVENAGSF